MAESSFLGALFGKSDRSALRAPHQFDPLCGPELGYVFLVTYGQSGDVLVQELLNAAPGVVVRGENGNLLRPMSKAWHHAERTVLASFATHSDQAAAEFENLTLLGWHLANSFARDVLALPRGTRLGGFREIRYHGNAHAFKQQLDFMAAFFPNARFVFNTRDVSRVAQTGWWREQEAAKVEKTLGDADELFERYISVSPGKCLHLRYDDYIADPALLAQMFAWLGVEGPEKGRVSSLIDTHRSVLETGLIA